MAEIKIRDRDGAMVRYAVYDDEGHFLKAAHRDLSEEIAEAKSRHVALIKVLAERESVVMGPVAEAEELPPLPDAPKATEHTHEEFSYPVGEHDHEPHEHDLAPHVHPLEKHGHDPHEHPLRVHSHPLEDHPHTNLDGRLGQMEADYAAYQGHAHAHDHVHSHEEDLRPLARGMIELRRMVEDLKARLDERSRPEHEHPE